jgi:cellulose synthase/poly-beta-1,6-N-acetylglucosamine synthase-like glycosyltransferase
LIIQKERLGKTSAINQLLKIASSHILVLESADTLPEHDTIEKLCIPFSNEKVGITGARPIPLDSKDTFLGFTVNLIWNLHHKIALKQPKFGELIAFRNIIKQIPETAVDEEEIARIIKENGYELKYVANAIVYNKGPENIHDFITQRRRIYSGHLELKKRDYEVSTLSNLKILFTLLRIIEFKPKHLLYIGFAILLEAYARLIGTMDFYRGKKHYIWDVIRSGKGLE